MGSLRGDSRKAKEAFGKYSSLDNPPEIEIEELEENIQSAEEELTDYTLKLNRLSSIDHEAVSYGDEDYIAARYAEFNEEFVPPKVQGLKEALLRESLTYNIDWKKVAGIELTSSVDAQSMQAAVEAIYGVEAMADVAFEKEFGVAKADIKAFLGVMGKAEVSASYNWDEVMLEAVADFFAGAKLTCHGELRAGSVDNNLTAKLSGTAIVGIEGTGSVSLKLTPGQLEAALKLSAFAGARATAEGEFGATLFGRSLFTSKLSASATVGIGASLNASVQVGVQNIGLSFGTELTFGVGTGTEAETTVNVGNCVMAFLEAKDRLMNAPAYIQGYSNLRLQEKEWKLKITALTKKYETMISSKTKEIDTYKKSLRKLQR